MNRAPLHVLREFFFSQIQGEPIYDHEGRRVGKLQDLAIRWEGEGPPRVTGIKFARGVQKHIPISQVEEMSQDRIRLAGKLREEDLIPLKPDEIYVGKWLMDKQIIDLKGSKVVRVNDIKLFWIQRADQRYLLPMAVDIGLRGLARRLGMEFLFKRRENHFVWWEYIQHLEEKTANLRLLQDKAQLDQMHPADLAEIIADLDYKKRTDFIEDLDVEVVAEAVAEMEPDTQIEILEHMESRQAAEILQEMPADEAADLLGELPEEKSDEILGFMEPEEAQEVRELMEYKEGTAGALMTTEFISLPPNITAAEAFPRLRKLAAEAETIYYLYILDENEKLLGVISLRELIMAEPEARLATLMQTRIISVTPQDSEDRVTELIDKYNLLALPVVDKNQRMLGIITVDDILEVLIPDRSSLETFANFFVSKRSGRG
uniref:Magnesium transporter n=1 Tax=Desulfobacca acetoxidans TaxID=60893 RepID=A0A7C3Z0K3_9BACT